MYDLQAVVHHQGTAHKGHYFAFVRDTGGGWCRYDDAEVTAATEAHALSSEAYILSYVKRRGAGVA
ncbi:unnamed protein product [Scytosiphon promiscuus]